MASQAGVLWKRVAHGVSCSHDVARHKQGQGWGLAGVTGTRRGTESGSWEVVRARTPHTCVSSYTIFRNLGRAGHQANGVAGDTRDPRLRG